MANTLHDVLNIFGYLESDKQIALVKLAAYRGCFDESYKNKIISDEVAKSLLLTSFDSLIVGVNWWVDTLDKKWLRSIFFKEGIGKAKDPVINVDRWNLELKSEEDDPETRELLKLFKILNLTQTVFWPEEKTSHVVIHGAISSLVRDRVNFIQDFSGKLYYMTSPRGLFNDEAFVAQIIASWFENPAYIPAIQGVLDRHKDLKTSTKNWLKDLEGLKQEILIAIGERVWPIGKGWYYKNPAPFEAAAKAEGRQSVAGWPTVMDLIEYLLQQRAVAEPGCFNNIELIPVYSVRPGRVPNTEDNVEDWYSQHGQYFPHNTLVTFVSNNSKGLHYIHFQDEMMKKVLHSLELPLKKLRTVTVGLGANEISLSAATDVFAKIFYSKRPGILKLIQSAEVNPSVKKITIVSSSRKTGLFSEDSIRARAVVHSLVNLKHQLKKESLTKSGHPLFEKVGQLVHQIETLYPQILVNR